MMGTSHAISGAAVYLAAATTTTGLGLLEVSTPELLAGTIVCAGAALLPDADHPNATIAYSVPGGSLLTGAIGAATGGHRKGMHGLAAVIAVYFGVVVVANLVFTPEGWTVPVHLGTALTVACCVAFAAKVLRLARSWLVAWIGGVAVAAVMTWLIPSNGTWLFAAVALGYATHLAGDMLTSGGVPLLWPLMPRPPVAVRNTPVLSSVWLPGGNFALPVLGNTGSWREQLLASALACYAVWCLVVYLVG